MSSAEPDSREDHIDQAATALGGEDSEWFVTARIDKGRAYLYLECRECERDGKPIYSTGQIELWELIVDAREHHEKQHVAEPERRPLITGKHPRQDGATYPLHD